MTESRRKLRIAEIEAELAESRLRRSRISPLNAELDYLRNGYLYGSPYYSYMRDYYDPLSSYSYPYASYYSRYRPYYYPY